MQKAPRQHRVIGLLAATIALALAGCSVGSPTDKAGGSAGPTTLTMIDVAANLDGFPAVQYFIDRVSVVSGGKLTIDLKLGWTNFASDAEQQIVDDVADGEADLARIGTRAFDRLGVTSLRALTAPMLIDNYPLQTAVINSDMPTQMLTGLEPLGVTGLAVLAGPMRRPAATKPLLSPSDWRGLTIETRASDVEVATVSALDATATEVVGPTLDRGLVTHEIDGLVTDLLQFDQNGRENTAPYVTANVALWPQTLALVINSDRLARLTDQQRDWLQQAADDALAYSLQVADQDATLLNKVCARGARFANASPRQLEEFRGDILRVYYILENDIQTDLYIDEILELKQHTYAGLGLPIPESCTGPAPIRPGGVNADPEATSALNGTYRYTLTAEHVRAWQAAHDEPPATEEEMRAYPNTYTVTLEDGEWTGRESSFPGPPAVGAYAVGGNLMTWYWPEGYLGTFRFTREADGTLHLTPVPGNVDPGGDFIMTAEPWTRID